MLYDYTQITAFSNISWLLVADGVYSVVIESEEWIHTLNITIIDS